MANITTPTNGTYQPVSNMDSGTVAASPGAGYSYTIEQCN